MNLKLRSLGVAALISLISSAQAEILVGWHTPDPSGPDSAPNLTAAGVTGLADGIQRQVNNGNGSGGKGSSGSTDNTCGALTSLGLDPVDDYSWAFETSSTNRSKLDVTITNNTGSALDLEGLHFDYLREVNAATHPDTITVTYLSGDLVVADDFLIGTISGITDAGTGAVDYPDADYDLTSLLAVDNQLADGESAIFRIKVSPDALSAHNSLYIDNLAITGAAPTVPAPASTIPAPAITWHSGSTTADTSLNGVTTTLTGTGTVSDASNGSTDGSHGSLGITNAPVTGGAFALTEGQILDVQLSNSSGRRVFLNQIYLDFNPRSTDSPTDVSVSYLSGDLDDTVNTVVGSLSGQAPIATDLGDYHDLDCALSTSLSDTFLDDGESATFRIMVSGASGSGTAYIDNIGFLAYRAPNLLVILSDDQGYADVGANTGNSEIPTPNIDRLSDEGVNCTSAYASYSVCGPSRAGIITGRYQQRFGFERNPQYGIPDGGVPSDEMMISETLQQVGYNSSVIGKWHLGSTELGHPLNRGFDEFYGFLGGSHKYILTSESSGLSQYTLEDSYKAKNESQSYQTWILDDHTPVDPSTLEGPIDPSDPTGPKLEWYLTDEFSAEAVDYITRKQNEPWFLYLSYNAPHSPMEAPDRYTDRFPSLKDWAKNETGSPYPSSSYPRKTYAAMVSAMDDGIGLVLDKLEELDLEDDTLVFFLSDNGGQLGTGANNDPLRGSKGAAYEGGIRVCYHVRWPGKIPAGVTYDDPVMSLDIFGTIAALTGAPANPGKPLDGVNILPYLAGVQSGVAHDAVYLRKEKQQRYAVVSGSDKFKFVYQGYDRLFDLANDVGEGTELQGSNPTRLSELQALRDTWVTGLIDPIFIGLTDPSAEYFDAVSFPSNPTPAAAEALLNQSMIDNYIKNSDESVTGPGNWDYPTLGTWTLSANADFDDPSDQGDRSLEITLPQANNGEFLCSLNLHDLAGTAGAYTLGGTREIALSASTQIQVTVDLLNINDAASNGIRFEFQDSSGTVAANLEWGGTNIGTSLNGTAFGTDVPFTARDQSDEVSGWDQYDANVRKLIVQLTQNDVSVNFDGQSEDDVILNGVTGIHKIAIYSLASGTADTAFYLDEIDVKLLTVGAYSPFTTAWASGSISPDVSMVGITAGLSTSGDATNAHGSTDGSYGSYNVVAPQAGGAFALQNNGTIDITATNDTGGNIMLQTLWLDFKRDRVDSPSDVIVTYLSGDLDDADGTTVGSLTNKAVISADLADFDDLDCILGDFLTDTVLASGESANFRISASGALGLEASYIDNIGIGTLLLSGIESTQVQENGDLRFGWTGENGRLYELQYRENLTFGDWTPVETYYGDGTQIQIDVAPIPGENNGFYRIVIE